MGGRSIELLAYVTVYVYVRRSASHHCCVQKSRSAQQCGCTHHLMKKLVTNDTLVSY